MSLTFRSIVCAVVIGGIGLTSWSCGSANQVAPTSPSAVPASGSPAMSGSSGERFSTTDEVVPLPAEPAPNPDAPAEPGVPPADGVPPAPVPADPAPVPPAPVPAPAPAPFPTPPVPENPLTPRPTPPTVGGPITARVNPDPVPHSGVPVPLFGCRDNRYTWYYEQILHSNVGHTSYKFTERENFFDGRFVSKIEESIVVEPNGTRRFNSRWCSAYPALPPAPGVPGALPTVHTAQTRFTGTDDAGNKIVVSGPLVRLLMP